MELSHREGEQLVQVEGRDQRQEHPCRCLQVGQLRAWQLGLDQVRAFEVRTQFYDRRRPITDEKDNASVAYKDQMIESTTYNVLGISRKDRPVLRMIDDHIEDSTVDRNRLGLRCDIDIVLLNRLRDSVLTGPMVSDDHGLFADSAETYER